jgi:hypothetical protein
MKYSHFRFHFLGSAFLATLSLLAGLPSGFADDQTQSVSSDQPSAAVNTDSTSWEKFACAPEVEGKGLPALHMKLSLSEPPRIDVEGVVGVIDVARSKHSNFFVRYNVIEGAGNLTDNKTYWVTGFFLARSVLKEGAGELTIEFLSNDKLQWVDRYQCIHVSTDLVDAAKLED